VRAERIGYEFERCHDELVGIAQHLRTPADIDSESLERFGRRAETLPHIRALMLFDDSVASLPGPEPKSRPPLFPREVIRFAHPPSAAEPEQHVEWAQRGIFAPPYVPGVPHLSEPILTDRFPYEPALYQAAIVLAHSGADDAATPRGFLVGVYAAQPMVEAVMAAAFNPLAVRLTDRALPDGRNLLAVYARPADSPRFARAVYSSILQVGGRQWEVSLMPTNEFVAKHTTQEPLLALLLGFSLTAAAAVAALLSALLRRSRLRTDAMRA